MAIELGVIIFLCIMLGLVILVAKRFLKRTEQEKRRW